LNDNRNTIYMNSESTVERGDHIRLQQVAIGKTFKKNQTHCSIQLTGEQLGILWQANKAKLDPIYYRSGILPTSTWSLQLNVNF
ncbi:MAG: hypothetical protein LBE37_06180, partial [Sphingobacterium sp.]|nr:hypothetical protein [Sphingobacterium sp.]